VYFDVSRREGVGDILMWWKGLGKELEVDLENLEESEKDTTTL